MSSWGVWLDYAWPALLLTIVGLFLGRVSRDPKTSCGDAVLVDFCLGLVVVFVYGVFKCPVRGEDPERFIHRKLEARGKTGFAERGLCGRTASLPIREKRRRSQRRERERIPLDLRVL